MVQTNVRRINLLDVKCLQTDQPKPAKASAASQPNPRLLFPALLTRRVSPPRPPPGHPRVVPILHPPNWWHPIQPTDRRPPAPKLPEHPADPRRPLKPRSTHLHRPRRPRDLRASEPQPLDQPRLLARPHIHPSAPIPTPNPPCQPLTEPALPVVHQGQTVACHRPKLH